MENIAVVPIETPPLPAAQPRAAEPGVVGGGIAIPAQPGANQMGTPVVKTQNGSFLTGITLMDVGMIALVTLALVTSLYVNRQHLLSLKARQKSEGTDIDELRSNLKALMGPDYKEF